MSAVSVVHHYLGTHISPHRSFLIGGGNAKHQSVVSTANQKLWKCIVSLQSAPPIKSNAPPATSLASLVNQVEYNNAKAD